MSDHKKLFIPKKINVGFQNRQDTYTGKLAFVVYYDQLGKLRKEKSWEGWRDTKIKPLECENVPTDGFVLNKDVGGARRSYGWNCRNEYVRVYDPRDFEFEISIANLLFILRECNCYKGKGLEGQFVYAWAGSELVLLPTCSEDYKNSSEFTELQAQKISAKELVLGATYMTKSQNRLIYLGRFERFLPYSPDRYCCYGSDCQTDQKKCVKKMHVFEKQNTDKHLHPQYEFLSSMSKLGAVVSDTAVPDYAEKVEQFHKSIYGSRVLSLDLGKPEKVELKKDNWWSLRSTPFAFERNGKFVLWYWSYNYHAKHFVNFENEVYIKDGLLTFKSYNESSYPPDWPHNNKSNIKWRDWENTPLIATMESGAQHRVGNGCLIYQ